MNFTQLDHSNQLYFDHIQQIWKAQLTVFDERFYFDVKDNQLSLAMEEDEIYQRHLIPKLSSHLQTTGTTNEILSAITDMSSLQDCEELSIHSFASFVGNESIYFTFNINRLPYKFKLVFMDFSTIKLSTRHEISSSYYPMYLVSLEHFLSEKTLNQIKKFFFQQSEYRVRLLFKQTYSNIEKLNL